MAFGTFKTLMNVGMNISNDYSVPVSRSLEKKKDFEIRIYEKTKYVVIKYESTEYKDETVTNDKSGKSKSSDKKEPNDQIMNFVWKIMKYTQGENEEKKFMKFYMPVFVHIDTIEGGGEGDDASAAASTKKTIVKIMVAMPPEYQLDKYNPDKQPPEPPKPNEQEISFEIVDEFKCYVRVFPGFTNDLKFMEETRKLRESLNDANLKVVENKCICISYDPPYKLFNRKNEVILIAS